MWGYNMYKINNFGMKRYCTALILEQMYNKSNDCACTWSQCIVLNALNPRNVSSSEVDDRTL